MKLSIITVNLNNAVGLQKTIDSVLAQTWQEFEHIIIDGGSTDGSKEIISQYTETKVLLTYNLKWISEPDSGIYEAMNKGIKKASGEYIHFLNSGDFLVDKFVYEKVFTIELKEDVIYGNKIEMYPDGSEILNKGLAKSNVFFEDVFKGLIPHSCSFSKRELFHKYDFFDETFKIAADTGFFLNTIGIHQSSVRYIDIVISKFDMTGISKKLEFKELRDQEIIGIRKKIMSPTLVNAYEFYLKYEFIIRCIKKRKITWFVFRLLYKFSRKIN